MIVCIKVLPKIARFPASDDPSGATVARTGRSDSEFTIIPALLFWQKSFIIAKNSAILVVRKRTALLDQLQRLARLARQLADVHDIMIEGGPGQNAEGKRERHCKK